MLQLRILPRETDSKCSEIDATDFVLSDRGPQTISGRIKYKNIEIVEHLISHTGLVNSTSKSPDLMSFFFCCGAVLYLLSIQFN